MDKIMNRIKNKQLLRFKDLINISKEIHDDNCEFICENNSPFYNYKYKKMGLSADITSRWFITDYMNYAKLKDVKVLFNEDELDKIKEPIFINEDTDIYNLLLLNEVLHETRHAIQEDILLKNYEGQNIDYLKHMIITKMKATSNIKYTLHDRLYNEYDADLYAALMVNKLNEEYINSEHIKSYNKFALYKILRGYLSLNCNYESSPKENTQALFGNVDDFINIFGFIVTNPYLESVHECYRYLDALKYLNDKKSVKEGNSFDKILYGSKLNNYELKNLKNILINSTDNLEKTLKR